MMIWVWLLQLVFLFCHYRNRLYLPAEGEPFRRDIRRFWYERQICIKNPDLFRTAPCISSVNGSYHPASCVLAGVKLLKDKPGNVLKLPGSSQKWMFVNYATAWGKGLLFYFKNSIIVSAISILCILLLSSMLAYGLTRFSLPGSGFVFFLILGGMALSEQVALVPLYKILQALKLYNTRAALILPYIAFRIPFTMFLMRAYFISIPKELEEAAIVDGCNSFQRFTQIILPISKPVMASCAIVNLNNVWNEFLFANVFLENKN